jgi:hypothetical protein
MTTVNASHVPKALRPNQRCNLSHKLRNIKYFLSSSYEQGIYKIFKESTASPALDSTSITLTASLPLHFLTRIRRPCFPVQLPPTLAHTQLQLLCRETTSKRLQTRLEHLARAETVTLTRFTEFKFYEAFLQSASLIFDSESPSDLQPFPTTCEPHTFAQDASLRSRRIYQKADTGA